MITPRDVKVLEKLIASHENKDWTQNSIATELSISASQVNSAFKKLVASRLLTPYRAPEKPQPIMAACEEFMTYALKFIL